MMDQANPEMLVLARESRNMRQGEVAAAMAELSDEPVSQGYVSRAEAGRLAVTGDRLVSYAKSLGFPSDLLCLDPQAAEVGVGLIHHRKKAALSAPSLRAVHAQLALARLQVHSLLAAAGRPALPDPVPHIEIDDLTTPTEAAAELRTKWGLAPGPIGNLIEVIENAGAVVLLRSLGSDLLDAVSQRSADGSALLLVNDHAPGDRVRFSLAHELGHLVMHRVPGSGTEQEKEADRFASAFLMPADDIRPSFAAGVSLAQLAEMKRQWKVSMGALLRRASDLNEISQWQYRNAVIEMSALGYRTSEPVEVPLETPRAMGAVVRSLAARYELDDLATRVYLLPHEFLHFYPQAAGGDNLPL
jgi:Zn-dependent peptidase ImmA (M78 family)